MSYVCQIRIVEHTVIEYFGRTDAYTNPHYSVVERCIYIKRNVKSLNSCLTNEINTIEHHLSLFDINVWFVDGFLFLQRGYLQVK